jgi:ribosomal protein S13
MKITVIGILIIGWMGGIGLVYAQSSIATPAEIYIPGQGMTKAQIWNRIHNQTAKVNADSKVGKLTADQATSLRASIQSVKNQVKADYVENGKKELTNDQKVALNSMLDQTGNNLRAVNGMKDWTGK